MPETRRVVNDFNIEVICHFMPDKISVIRYRWKDTVFKVTKQLSYKVTGQSKTVFTLICEEADTIAELGYYHDTFKWELIQWDTL